MQNECYKRNVLLCKYFVIKKNYGSYLLYIKEIQTIQARLERENRRIDTLYILATQVRIAKDSRK